MAENLITEYMKSAGNYVDPNSSSGNNNNTSSQSAQTHALGVPSVFLTASCTQALEMAAILSEVKAGDEVILPSFTFVSSVNPFVLRGATPVFVDVNEDDINISVEGIRAAITSRTRVIVVVHYAGVSCDMPSIMGLARQHNLIVVEDAAHSYCAKSPYGTSDSAHGRMLGRGKEMAVVGVHGDFTCFSFHATKNVIMGEGGALVVNNAKYARRAHYIWEKGTNRLDFIEGKIDKYSWVDIGSSFLPPETSAAVLYEQLKIADKLCEDRLRTWIQYHNRLSQGAQQGLYKIAKLPKSSSLRITSSSSLSSSSPSATSSASPSTLPSVEKTRANESESKGDVGEQIDGDGRINPGHIFWLVFPTIEARKRVEAEAKERKIGIIGHYVPLHASAHGKRVSRVVNHHVNISDSPYVQSNPESLPVTDKVYDGLLRLPIWTGMRQADIDRVVDCVLSATGQK